MTDLQALQTKLKQIGQDHLLRFYDELDQARQMALLSQVEAIDSVSLPRLIQQYVANRPRFTIPEDLTPAPFYPNDPNSPTRPWDHAAATTAGEELLQAGKVAAFTVAGGQGTRLGYDGPKGCFRAGAITGKPLFAFFAEGLSKTVQKFGATAPWYIMTSPLNHEPTIAFFKKNNFFGLNEHDVMFFPQGVLPSFDMTSEKILLRDKATIATNPDGHGGSIKALFVSGAIEDMRNRGVEQISYFQVDNPIVRVLDPVFLGLHVAAKDSSGQMSSKMIPKAYPQEKVGVFCTSGGKTQVIEYSDLPEQQTQEKDKDGQLRFMAGSIAIHIMSVRFVERLNTDAALELPYHRAEKKVASIDPESGKPCEPKSPNAVKLERFVFDALLMCDASIVYETDRIEEFAPIKNATGVDSVQSSEAIQTMRAARWLKAAGVEVPLKEDGAPDCVIELSPLTAVETSDLLNQDLPDSIKPGDKVAI